MTVAVTLSGGGARAAAFGYGVLDGLRQTRFVWNGRQTSLLDEIDVISGVSGGSIVAAYYAAFGPRTFPQFRPGSGSPPGSTWPSCTAARPLRTCRCPDLRACW